jgi:hypothetical protein
MANSENQPLRSQPPVLLDQVVQFLVWTGVISSLAAPLIGIALIWRTDLFRPLFGPADLTVSEVQRRLIEARSWMGDNIAGGGNTGTLVRDANRLRELTAYDGEAKTVARELEVIVVRLVDGTGPSDTEQAPPARTGYRTIGLDLSAADRTATLIIADAPVLWNVQSNPRSPRARLALEGTAPFDIANPVSGMLAGFRIESFGVSGATRPQDALDKDSDTAKRYCNALALWAQHFGLTLADTTATFIENPRSIRVSDRSVTHDGRELPGRTPFATCPITTRLR